MEEGFHLGGAKTMDERGAVESLQGALMLAFHGRTGAALTLSRAVPGERDRHKVPLKVAPLSSHPRGRGPCG
ncbi:MAG: hypothetical protein ACK55Z_20205 [bacterium]